MANGDVPRSDPPLALVTVDGKATHDGQDRNPWMRLKDAADRERHAAAWPAIQCGRPPPSRSARAARRHAAGRNAT